MEGLIVWAFVLAMFIVPCWLLGWWLTKDDRYIPDDRPPNLNEEDRRR